MSGGITATTVLWSLLFFDALILLIATGFLLLNIPFTLFNELFSLDVEVTIPAWYSSVKLLLLACLLAALSVSISAGPWPKWALLGTALVFLAMSCDEAAAVHERLQRAIDNRFPTGVTGYLDVGTILAQVAIGLAGLAIAAFAVITVMRTLQGIERGKIAFGAGFLLLGIGAVGIDLPMKFLSLSATGKELWAVLEEGCEMIGVTLMIYGVLQALACAPVTLYLGARLYSGASRPRD